MAATQVHVDPSSRQDTGSEALVKWLVDNGVGAKRARKFVLDSGCYSRENMALYLRFKLAPLAIAKEESFLGDLQEMLGVHWRLGRKLIKDLDIAGAINMDLEAEVREHTLPTIPLPDGRARLLPDPKLFMRGKSSSSESPPSDIRASTSRGPPGTRARPPGQEQVPIAEAEEGDPQAQASMDLRDRQQSAERSQGAAQRAQGAGPRSGQANTAELTPRLAPPSVIMNWLPGTTPPGSAAAPASAQAQTGDTAVPVAVPLAVPVAMVAATANNQAEASRRLDSLPERTSRPEAGASAHTGSAAQNVAGGYEAEEQSSGEISESLLGFQTRAATLSWWESDNLPPTSTPAGASSTASYITARSRGTFSEGSASTEAAGSLMDGATGRTPPAAAAAAPFPGFDTPSSSFKAPAETDSAASAGVPAPAPPTPLHRMDTPSHPVIISSGSDGSDASDPVGAAAGSRPEGVRPVAASSGSTTPAQHSGGALGSVFAHPVAGAEATSADSPPGDQGSAAVETTPRLGPGVMPLADHHVASSSQAAGPSGGGEHASDSGAGPATWASALTAVVAAEAAAGGAPAAAPSTARTPSTEIAPAPFQAQEPWLQAMQDRRPSGEVTVDEGQFMTRDISGCLLGLQADDLPVGPSVSRAEASHLHGLRSVARAAGQGPPSRSMPVPDVLPTVESSGSGSNSVRHTLSGRFSSEAPSVYQLANTELRKNVPDYTVEVQHQVFWSFIFVYIVSVIVFLAYVGVRLYYLITGRVDTIDDAAESQTVSVPYSYVVLAAETALGFIGFFGTQTFVRQKPVFTPRVPERLGQGAVKVTQRVHVIVPTYSESAEMVEECVVRLLVAPEPDTMEVFVYVADDGYKNREGPGKRTMVTQLRALGHNNVFYVGDRVKQSHQLNGKAANLNHVLAQHIYPGVKSASEIDERDIVMVMDCDHMVKADIFKKMGAAMNNPAIAMVLVPQWYHNLLKPDCFDAANADFMFSKMPYYFGAGLCYITGTNFMLRARVAYECASLQPPEHKQRRYGLHLQGDDAVHVLREDQVSEDLELGMRVCALGYKALVIPEKLATGEVPEHPRDMWRQRLRWYKGAHVVLVESSHVVFSRQRPGISFYQRALYMLVPICHFTSIWANPIMATLPILCVGYEICPYGLDKWLYLTHVTRMVTWLVLSVWQPEWWLVNASVFAKSNERILYFTSCKAALNMLMVLVGFKAPGKFKSTVKSGSSRDDRSFDEVSVTLSDKALDASPVDSGGRSPDHMPEPSLKMWQSTETASHERTQGLSDYSGARGGSEENAKPSESALKDSTRPASKLQKVHDGLSKFTEKRRELMPLDGTLDIWVLALFTMLNVVAVVIGTVNLIRDGAFEEAQNVDNVKWIAVVFAFTEAVPGLLYLMYVAVWNSKHASLVMKIWAPLVVGGATLGIVGIEAWVLSYYIREGGWGDFEVQT